MESVEDFQLSEESDISDVNDYDNPDTEDSESDNGEDQEASAEFEDLWNVSSAGHLTPILHF